MNQFGWLLALSLQARECEDGEKAITQIRSWIVRLGAAKDDPAWRSFSISERICNWFHLADIFGAGAGWEEVAASIEIQAHHLARRLESFRDGSTNNHLLNNARALYTAGIRIGHGGLARLGREILLQEASRQFTEEGFLDEGSSHYQIVFTRAYVEALALARTAGDRGMASVLEPKVRAMLRACAFLQDTSAPEGWQIPFFGDISPDPPPAFFPLGMNFWQMAEEAKSGLREKSFSRPWYAAREETHAPVHLKGWSCFHRSGYYRWNGDAYSVWWHARRRGAPRRHAHNDWGSFQLHYGGEPLIIDPGRESYCEERAGLHDGRMTLGQNCLMINGLEQAVMRRRDLFLPEYVSDGSEVEWEGDHRAGSFSCRVIGYERLAESLVHTRTFRLRPGALTVEDILQGRGAHTATSALHLHPGVRCLQEEGNVFVLETPQGRRARLRLPEKGEIRVKREGDLRLPGGYCFPMYDERRETTTIFAGCVFEPGQRAKTEIQFL